MLFTAGLLGVFCGVLAVDCTQRNYCLGGITNQFWLMDNEDKGVQQFSMGHGGLMSLMASFGNLVVSGYSYFNYRRINERVKSKLKAKHEGERLAEDLWMKQIDKDEFAGFI